MLFLFIMKWILNQNRISTFLFMNRSGQAGELGREEPDEVQQGQVQGPAPGEEQPHASVQAWGGPAGEQLCGEGPGCPGG